MRDLGSVGGELGTTLLAGKDERLASGQELSASH
jgi:hypothetical protein